MIHSSSHATQGLGGCVVHSAGHLKIQFLPKKKIYLGMYNTLKS